MGNNGIAWDFMGVNGFLRYPQGRNGKTPDVIVARQKILHRTDRNLAPCWEARETGGLSTKSEAAFYFIEAWMRHCGVPATTH